MIEPVKRRPGRPRIQQPRLSGHRIRKLTALPASLDGLKTGEKIFYVKVKIVIDFYGIGDNM